MNNKEQIKQQISDILDQIINDTVLDQIEIFELKDYCERIKYLVTDL